VLAEPAVPVLVALAERAEAVLAAPLVLALEPGVQAEEQARVLQVQEPQPEPQQEQEQEQEQERVRQVVLEPARLAALLPAVVLALVVLPQVVLTQVVAAQRARQAALVRVRVPAAPARPARPAAAQRLHLRRAAPPLRH
jgi:hypothetical protein